MILPVDISCNVSAASIYSCNKSEPKARIKINVSFKIKVQRMPEAMYMSVSNLLLGC
jgi:hypothetical protein